MQRPPVEYLLSLPGSVPLLFGFVFWYCCVSQDISQAIMGWRVRRREAPPSTRDIFL